MEERDHPMRPAGLLDALVDVLPVGQEDVLSSEQTQHEGEADVEDDEDHGRDDDDDGHTEDEQPDSEDEHGGTDPIAPGVAEEGLGPAQVERQESDRSGEHTSE